MDNKGMDQRTVGVLLGLGAYGWWGAVTAVYYHQLQDVPVLELVSWRVLAGLPLMLLMLWGLRKLDSLRRILADPRTLGLLVLSALLIGINWFVFIIAVVPIIVIVVAFSWPCV